MSVQAALRLVAGALLWAGPLVAGLLHMGWHWAAVFGLVMFQAFLLEDGADAFAERLGEGGALVWGALFAFGLAATLYGIGAGLLSLLASLASGADPKAMPLPRWLPAGLSLGGLALAMALPPRKADEADPLTSILRWLHHKGGGHG